MNIPEGVIPMGSIKSESKVIFEKKKKIVINHYERKNVTVHYVQKGAIGLCSMIKKLCTVKV